MNSPPGNLTIYFVRHGQTDTNVQGLMVGQSGSPALTETGRIMHISLERDCLISGLMQPIAVN